MNDEHGLTAVVLLFMALSGKSKVHRRFHRVHRSAGFFPTRSRPVLAGMAPQSGTPKNMDGTSIASLRRAVRWAPFHRAARGRHHRSPTRYGHTPHFLFLAWTHLGANLFISHSEEVKPA